MANHQQQDLYTVGILTVSDSSAADNSLDKSGPLLHQILHETNKYTVKASSIVADDMHDIRKRVQHWTDTLALNVILITGGTGFSDRDVTPEAVKPLLTKETSGITHLLLSTSIAITPFAALSRPITGIRNKSFIITLPGSPKACKENMQAVLKVLPHALDLLLDRKKEAKKVHQDIQGHVCTHRQDHEHHTGVSASLDTPVSRRARSSPYPLISVEKALDIIAEHSKPLNVINVPVSQFLTGYVLAEDVESLEPVPGYRASTVDGYAVHVEDGPGVYTIETTSRAELSNGLGPLSRGKIARVTTGSMVPDGANAVVMVEDTTLIKSTESGDEELEVEILVQLQPGENIREIGSDCATGQIVGRQGQRITGDLGVLASVGIRHVKAYRKPRVGVLSSGNEVLDHLHTDSLQPGQIRDTNRITLLAAIQASGFEAVDLGIVNDDVDELTERLEESLNKCDVLVTTGGVSMGEADFIKPILEQKLDATVQFGRVLMKPGKPTTFATVPQGTKRSKLVFALPGNPVSATVGFYLFVLPSLKRLAGWSRPDNVEVPVFIKHDIRLDSRPEFHRVQVSVDQDGKFVAESTGKQQSSRMLSMVDANGLLKLPESTPELKELHQNTRVQCILFGNL